MQTFEVDTLIRKWMYTFVSISNTSLGGISMGRNSIHKNRDKNKQTLPQVPKNLKSDGLDIEFSKELADQDDLEARQRSKEADARAKSKK
jgi:hypothetical protein